MEIRISPSQVNLFLNEPAIWVLNKFFGIYGDMGAAAKRGNMVELGLNLILLNDMDYKTALSRSLELFDQEMKEIEDEKTEEERANIPGMLEQAVSLFLNIDTPIKTQVRLEPDCLSLPVLGVADYEMENYMVDLKTTTRCPSAAENISAEHIRQTTIYHLASGKPQKLAYVTPKKHALYEISQAQINQAKKEIEAAARAMKAAYEIEEKQGKDALTILYPPRDTSSFYWDLKTLNKANEIWF